MAARVRVKRIDRGWNQIRKKIKNQRWTITVGVQGKEADTTSEDGDTTLADVAVINEMGLGVPERSFIRSTLDANRRRYNALMGGVGDAAVAGKITVERGAKLVALVVEGDVKQAIADGIPPPNEESTIKAKGSSTPLIDTGQLRGAITSKVEASKSLGGRR